MNTLNKIRKQVLICYISNTNIIEPQTWLHTNIYSELGHHFEIKCCNILAFKDLQGPWVLVLPTQNQQTALKIVIDSHQLCTAKTGILQKINISHLCKRKLIFPTTFQGDVIVPRIIYIQVARLFPPQNFVFRSQGLWSVTTSAGVPASQVLSEDQQVLTRLWYQIGHFTPRNEPCFESIYKVPTYHLSTAKTTTTTGPTSTKETTLRTDMSSKPLYHLSFIFVCWTRGKLRKQPQMLLPHDPPAKSSWWGFWSKESHHSIRTPRNWHRGVFSTSQLTPSILFQLSSS